MPGQIAPKGIIAGSTRSLRCNADDAEVVPPDAVVVTGFTPGWIAGSTRSLREDAEDAEVVPPAISHRITFYELTVRWRDIVSMSAGVVRASGQCPSSISALCQDGSLR